MSQTQGGLTTRQAIIWFTMYEIGSSFLVLPSYLATAAKQDAWISVLIGIGIQFGIVFVYAAIVRQLNGKSMVVHFQRLFGKIVGGCIIFVFIWAVPFLIFILTLRNLGDFMANSVMPETPSNAIYLLMLIPVYFAVRSSITVIGRSSELFFYTFILLYVLVVITFIPSMNFRNLLPVLEYGWKPVIQTSFVILGFPYLENFLYLFIIPQYEEPAKIKKIIIISSLISGGMFLLMMVTVTSVLSAGVMAHLPYVSYYSVRTITIAEFIERFEIVVTVFWHIAIFFRLSLLLYITSHLLSEVFKLQENRSMLIPLLLIGLISANFIWPNLASLYEAFAVWYLYALAFGLVLPLILWLIGLVRARQT